MKNIFNPSLTCERWILYPTGRYGKGICTHCKEHFEFEEVEAEHIKSWNEGGKTTPENGQMLCKMCNRTKSGK